MKLEDMKPAERKKRIAKLVKNPGTRAAIADKFLPEPYRKQRTLNTRLAAPVVEGSSVTVGDLAKQRKSASALKYGPAETDLGRSLAAAQQQQRDTGGWYDQYKAELAQHQANTAAIGQQENAQLQQFGGAVTGLDQAQLNATTQASVADAATRGTVPGADAAVQMNQGSAVRQALLGSFGAMMSAQAGAGNQYANTLSHVVAPGQKLQGMATAQGRVRQVGQKQTDLAREKGSFEQQFEDEFKQNESKNVLAQKIATGKTAQEQQKIDIAAALAAGTAAKTAAGTKKTEADTKKTNADISFFNKHGYYPGTSKPKAATGYQPGGPGLNKYGFTADEWNGLGPAARQKARAGKGAKPKAVDPATQDTKDFYAKYKVQPVTTVQLNSAKSNIQTASTWVRQVLESNPKMPLAQVGQLLSRGQAADKKAGSPAIPKLDPLFVRVAMDIKQFGGVTAGTADRLHHAGYSVAKLGIKPGKPKPKPPRTTRPGAGLVPGVGGT